MRIDTILSTRSNQNVFSQLYIYIILFSLWRAMIFLLLVHQPTIRQYDDILYLLYLEQSISSFRQFLMILLFSIIIHHQQSATSAALRVSLLAGRLPPGSRANVEWSGRNQQGRHSGRKSSFTSRVCGQKQEEEAKVNRLKKRLTRS